MSEPKPQTLTSAEVSPEAPLGRSMLALNNGLAQELSWLAPERLHYLVAHAFLARKIGDLDAFLLALAQDALTTAMSRGP